jgi:hypothetical protein
MGSVTGQPAITVAPPRKYGWAPLERAKLIPEMIRDELGPGDRLNRFGSYDYEHLRTAADRSARVEGARFDADRAIVATDLRNPDAPDGRWDPRAWMPRFVFDAREDAFPVSPGFDGTATLADNVAGYDSGRITPDQPLNMGFTVSRKAGYTVASYHLYLAHNKAGKYHANDYATAQVYLKPGRDGKLAPTHVFVSWHRGGALVEWKDLAKDADGRPVLKVNLGTHAMQPVGKGGSWDEDGLVITGKGQAKVHGEAVPARLGFEAFQTNVVGAKRLEPGSPAWKAREHVTRWGGAALDPYLPESAAKRTLWVEMKDELAERAAPVVARVERTAERVERAAKGLWAKLT